MRKYTRALWLRDLEADIVNVKMNMFNEVDYGSILKAVGCRELQLEVADLPYGLKVYHDKDGLRREGAYVTTIAIHAMEEEHNFGGNILVISEENGKRVGLNEYQMNTIKNKNLFTAGFSGKVAKNKLNKSIDI